MARKERSGEKKPLSKRKKIVIWVAAILLAVMIVNGAVVGTLYSPRKETPKGDGPRIVCIGDSITFGAGVMFSRNRDAWPRILERELEGEYEVLNYGISGATLTKTGDQPYAPDFWEAAKNQQAQIYILMLGTNDSKPQNWDAAEYTRQLNESVRELKVVPSVEKVYLMVPPPAFKRNETDDYAVYKIDGDVIREEIRGIVEECAEQNDVELIDLYSLIEDHPEYLGDGVHPNKEGNKVIAAFIATALQES